MVPCFANGSLSSRREAKSPHSLKNRIAPLIPPSRKPELSLNLWSRGWGSAGR